MSSNSHLNLEDQKFRGAKMLVNELLGSSDEDEAGARDSCSDNRDEVYHGLRQNLAAKKSKLGGRGDVKSKKKGLVHKSATHSSAVCSEF